MRLALALTTEVVVPMVTEGAVVATVAVDPGEEGSEDISSLGCCEGSLNTANQGLNI